MIRFKELRIDMNLLLKACKTKKDKIDALEKVINAYDERLEFEHGRIAYSRGSKMRVFISPSSKRLKEERAFVFKRLNAIMFRSK